MIALSLIWFAVFGGWFLLVRFVIDKEGKIKFGWDYWMWAILLLLAQLIVVEVK